MSLKNFFSQNNPYQFNNSNKNELFLNFINQSTRHHYGNCKEYKKILNFFNYNPKIKYDISDLPYLPVQLFKHNELLSVKKNKIVKILHSSGTSTGMPSKIFLDKENSNNQINALKNIFQYHFGDQRLPMLIIEKKSLLTNNNNFDAKKAAFYGFSIFGKNYSFALNSLGEIDYDSINDFLTKYSKNNFIIFGFTNQVFETLINKLDTKKLDQNLRNGILIHGGGWKKMENNRISKKEFKKKLKIKTKIHKVFNYYGLVEQTGSIFFQCSCGYFTTSNFSDVLIRDSNFNLCKDNQKGFIQLLSVLPTSYPGHNILTQDIGEIISSKNLKCGLDIKHFEVHGRSKIAEVRGCSDA